MTTSFDRESENLRNAWLRHPAGFLDSYLIQGVENPCFNPQSVTLRHLVLDALQPGQHRDLAEQEMLYSACVCATIAAAGRGTFDAFTAALEGEPNADVLCPLPPFPKELRDGRILTQSSPTGGNPKTFATEGRPLPLSPQRGEGRVRGGKVHSEQEIHGELEVKGDNLPDGPPCPSSWYQGAPLPFTLRSVWQQVLDAILNSYTGFTSPFEPLWCERLASVKTPRPTLLEAACGSANDFRYFTRYGLDTLVDYTGVDLCATNITNARRRCPSGNFLEADALSLPFPDRSFDFFCVFDLFEHLSLAAFHRALSEAVRVTRRKLWLSFFSLEDRPDHLEVPSPPYYLNTLSARRTLDELSRLGCDATVIDLPAEWSRKFPGYQHYNPRAGIIEASVRS